jgi:hypothetical protein
MSPILTGVIASGISGNLTPAASPSFYSIASASGGGPGNNTITFNSIPQNYTHLQVRAIDYCLSSGTGIGEWYVRFNGDTTSSNYYKLRYHGYGNGNLVGQNSAVGSEGIWGTTENRANAAGMGAFTMDIHNYTSSNYKTMIARGGSATTSAIVASVAMGPWLSTNAITSITIEANGGGFASTSRFGLYGIL